MIYYTSDIHFQDARVFRKCSRPFDNLDIYQEEIIKRWNAKVKDDDTVYVLGDIAEDSYYAAIEIMRNLKGHKHFIIGNHDLKMLDKIIASNVFESVKYMDLIYDNGRPVHICHYPIMDWMEFSREGYHVYGHIHNKYKAYNPAYEGVKEYYKDKKAYNCGVDVTNYEPVTLDEMIKLKEENINEPYIN